MNIVMGALCGAIGGFLSALFGLVAAVVNAMILRSKLHIAVKILLCILTIAISTAWFGIYYVIALAIEGKMLDSVELSDLIARLGVQGKSSIAFVIGGSLGLSDAVLKRADYKLSFSRMTFPHPLMRVILLEQLYRALNIGAGGKYHH